MSFDSYFTNLYNGQIYFVSYMYTYIFGQGEYSLSIEHCRQSMTWFFFALLLKDYIQLGWLISSIYVLLNLNMESTEAFEGLGNLGVPWKF